MLIQADARRIPLADGSVQCLTFTNQARLVNPSIVQVPNLIYKSLSFYDNFGGDNATWHFYDLAGTMLHGKCANLNAPDVIFSLPKGQ